MNELKFELSVLFTKNTQLSPYRDLEMIKDGYKKLFGKEVGDEELNKELGVIINDQIEIYNGFVIEIPDDFEI